MGFIGMRTVLESDAASDEWWMLQRDISKRLNKMLKFKGNEHNTCGPVNVALIIVNVFLPSEKHITFSDEFIEICKKTVKELEYVWFISGRLQNDIYYLISKLNKFIERQE